MTEKQIETQILQWLNAQPSIFAFKVNTVGVYDSKKKIYRKNWNPFVIQGTSDIIGVCNGYFFAIEVKKSAKEKLTDNQFNFLTKVTDKKGIAFKAYSLDEVIQQISALIIPARAEGLSSKLFPLQKRE